jgi:rubrerythrin
VRSRAAASILKAAGFSTVHSMQGGIRAWEGMTAPGPPEAGMAFFTMAATAEELIALAWMLEEGSRRFYEGVRPLLTENDGRDLFPGLASAEQSHKLSLEKLYETLTGAAPGDGFPSSLLSGAPENDYMEGGVRVSEALAWAQGKGVQEVLELSMSLEVASYDLYIKMEQRVEEVNAKKVFQALSNEEKAHLERLASLLGRTI